MEKKKISVLGVWEEFTGECYDNIRLKTEREKKRVKEKLIERRVVVEIYSGGTED